MAKIRMLVPQYIKEFNCIGGECEDTCCKNWTITVDKRTYKKYKTLRRNDLSPLLNKSVIRKKDAENVSSYAEICLREDGCCPFLGKDGLCEIYRQLSYESMPFTCRVYPRVINDIDGIAEMSLLLSCPEAARKALLSKDIMEFEFIEIEYEEFLRWRTRFLSTKGENLEKEEHRYFWDIRMTAIDILQNRRFTIVERLMLLGMMYKRIQGCIDAEEYEDIPVQIDAFMKLIEVVNPRELFEDMEQNKAIQVYVSKIIIGTNGIGKKNVPVQMRELIKDAEKVYDTFEKGTFLDVASVERYKKYIEEMKPFF